MYITITIVILILVVSKVVYEILFSPLPSEMASRLLAMEYRLYQHHPSWKMDQVKSPLQNQRAESIKFLNSAHDKLIGKYAQGLSQAQDTSDCDQHQQQYEDEWQTIRKFAESKYGGDNVELALYQLKLDC